MPADLRDVPLEALHPGPAAFVLRGLGQWLERAADALERPSQRRLPLEPVHPARDIDEAMHERRHQLFTRYY
ncbi:MAG TPA: hypothetical protein VF038_12300 [Usitatibacter sp.]